MDPWCQQKQMRQSTDLISVANMRGTGIFCGTIQIRIANCPKVDAQRESRDGVTTDTSASTIETSRERDRSYVQASIAQGKPHDDCSKLH
mmetsp:Transcript_12978/g.35820  ORF Transcript_12978/g.35820 Transcript_12978/m.35820 type:complete len:90 (-) Transcript_12978:34-303(-)